MKLTHKLISALTLIGRITIEKVRQIGSVWIFLSKSVYETIAFPVQLPEIINQIFFIGAKSLFIVCVTGIFTGMVLGLQGYYTLIKFASEDMLGSAVALSLIREMGPVFTSIMVTARSGSAMAAELGIMRISEQIDALKTMNLNPIRFLVAPKLTATIISLPILTSIFDLTGIMGGYLSGSVLLGLNSEVYFNQAKLSIHTSDITSGFIKSLFFAVVLATTCCFKGYFTHNQNEMGAKGVGISTTSAVVLSCTIILIADYIITSLLL